MKQITEYLQNTISANVFETMNPEQIIARIKELKDENDKLGDESDELVYQYGCDDTTGEDEVDEEVFFNTAPDDVLARNSQIWDEIAKNEAEIAKLRKQLAQIKEKATAFREQALKHDITRTTCAYDTRDVAAFIAKKTTLEEINKSWPIKYKSIFDISFSIESKEALHQSPLP